MKYLFAVVCLFSLTPCIADDHLVIVFDNSGSMDQMMFPVKKTRMNVAQEALISVMKQVPPTTKVGILTFNRWIYDLQSVDIEKIEKAIRYVKSDCPQGTPLYEYIRYGADRLLQEREKNNNIGSYKMLVVTDGAANDSILNQDSMFFDGTPKPGVLKDILNRGLIVDCIGLEIPNDHALKDQINGSYMRGDDQNSLTTAVRKSVAEVGFGQTKDASEEAFKEIAELPEVFVAASIKGLTTFSNHSIGSKPTVEQTASSQQIPVQTSSDASLVLFFCSGFTFFLFVVIIVACILKRF